MYYRGARAAIVVYDVTDVVRMVYIHVTVHSFICCVSVAVTFSHPCAWLRVEGNSEVRARASVAFLLGITYHKSMSQRDVFTPHTFFLAIVLLFLLMFR